MGYENEGALYNIAAVLNGFFARSNTANGKSLYGILYRSERSITDGTGVTCYGCDNITGRGQFLTVLTLIFGIGDRLKAISCTATRFTADEYDFCIVTADFFPILDFTGVDLCDGFNIEIRNGVVRIYNDCDAIIGEDCTFKSVCLFFILEITAGKSDVTSAFVPTRYRAAP